MVKISGGVRLLDHPIDGLLKTAMESIKEMIDVNTVIGEAVETPDGYVIIPISRLSCGFAAGGGEYITAPAREATNRSLPFGGGSGAGVSVRPVGFLVVGRGEVRLLPVETNAIFERLIDLVPRLIQEFRGKGDARGRKAPDYQGGV